MILYVFSATKSSPKSRGKRRDVEVAGLHPCCSMKACCRRWTQIVCKVLVRIPRVNRHRKRRTQGPSVEAMFASCYVSTKSCCKATANKNEDESSEDHFVERSIPLAQKAELSLQRCILITQHVSPIQTRLMWPQAVTSTMMVLIEPVGPGFHQVQGCN